MGTGVPRGAVGSGATMKLAVNTVVYGLNQSLSEALVLAERAGLDRRLTYEVFAEQRGRRRRSSTTGGRRSSAPARCPWRSGSSSRPGTCASSWSSARRWAPTFGRRRRTWRSWTRRWTRDSATRTSPRWPSFLRDKNPVPPAGIPERGGLSLDVSDVGTTRGTTDRGGAREEDGLVQVARAPVRPFDRRGCVRRRRRRGRHDRRDRCDRRDREHGGWSDRRVHPDDDEHLHRRVGARCERGRRRARLRAEDDREQLRSGRGGHPGPAAAGQR